MANGFTVNLGSVLEIQAILLFFFGGIVGLARRDTPAKDLATWVMTGLAATFDPVVRVHHPCPPRASSREDAALPQTTGIPCVHQYQGSRIGEYAGGEARTKRPSESC